VPWFNIKIIENVRTKSDKSLTSLKLFLTKTPIIKRVIIDADKNNSGNIYTTNSI